MTLRNRELASWILLAAWLLSNAKTMEESQSDLQPRVLKQAKGQTPCCVNKTAGLLLAHLEGTVSSPGGKRNPVNHGADSDTTPELHPVNVRLFYLTVRHSASPPSCRPSLSFAVESFHR